MDLPTKEDRQEIFRVHIQKRALKPEDFDLDVLAEKSEHFSGAEIEGAVKDAVLEAFIDGNRAAQTKDVVAAIGTITPTAEMMKAKIDEIREWAKNNIKASRAAAGIGQTTNTTGARFGNIICRASIEKRVCFSCQICYDSSPAFRRA